MIAKKALYPLSLAALVLAQSTARLDHLPGSLARDEAQPIYSAEPADPWNRIFHELFTRSVHTRLSSDFPEGAPFRTIESGGDPLRQVSARSFERIESGDLAIEPLYPSFLHSSDGPFQALDEPRHSRLASALTDALREATKRPPLARALMQSDAWAAHDILARDDNFHGADARLRREHRDELLQLLARLIQRLALTPDEIAALPDNYAAAAGAHSLPDLFGPQSGWLEVLWQPRREHETSSDDRRVARVFVKPAKPPSDKTRFLAGLPNVDDLVAQLDSVALVVQNLLIDSSGKAVPSHLTSDIQLRTFVKNGRGRLAGAELSQYELSRKLLLEDPRSGGLVTKDDEAPSYLPTSGNDYGFASNQLTPNGVGEPILVPLRARCTACHGEHTARVFTFLSTLREGLPPVVQLNPANDEHGCEVAERKMQRADFQALQRK